MEKASWTYFILLGLSLFYPLIQSFERRVFMFRKMKFMVPGILITASVFIVWDLLFTEAGVWGFNHNYTRDSYPAGLPLEEWLFFIVVPYCCFFLYEVLRYFVRRFYFPDGSRYIILGMLGASVISIPFIYDKTYTLTVIIFVDLMLILQLLQKSYRSWFSGFLLTYLVSLIPFMIINGILTYLPVVWYDNSENLGIRIYTIPVEDLIYLFGLLLPGFNIYNLLIRRFGSLSLKERMLLFQPTGF